MPKFCSHSPALGFVVGAILLGLAAPSFALTMPYTNDFSSSAADFTTNGGTWALNTGGSGIYKNTISANATSSSAMLQVTNLGGSTDQSFVMSTTFTINSTNPAGSNNTVGFAALSSDNNTTDSTGNYYLADVQANGNVRLIRISGSSSSVLAQSDATNAIANDVLTGVEYTLKLEGTYNLAGDLTLALSLTGGTQNQSINSTVLDASVITGNFFGLRNRTNTTSSLETDFNSFSITAPVPEPSGIALALAGILGVVIFMRRRQLVSRAVA